MTINKETIKNLSRIQKELKAPKNQFNKFGNYKYRSCEDILEGIKPLLYESIITIQDEICMIGDRFYIKATATFTDQNGSISTTSYAREELSKKGMDVSQVTGAASSYARKYALNALVLCDDTKDADSMNNSSNNNHGNRQVPKGGNQSTQKNKSFNQDAKPQLSDAEKKHNNQIDRIKSMLSQVTQGWEKQAKLDFIDSNFGIKDFNEFKKFRNDKLSEVIDFLSGILRNFNKGNK